MHRRSFAAGALTLAVLWSAVLGSAGQAAPADGPGHTVTASVPGMTVKYELRSALPASERRAVLARERAALADANASSLAQLVELPPCTASASIESAVAADGLAPDVGVLTTACPICSIGIPCGNTCISARFTCRTFGGCASYGGPFITTPSIPEYARTPEFMVGSQSAYPTMTVGETAELRMRVLVERGPSWFDKDVAMHVSNSEEAGRGLRGWDHTGLIAYNKGFTFLGTAQDFVLKVQALAPGAHRLRVKFVHKTFGTVGPDGAYWDVNVLPSPRVQRLYEGWHSRWAGQSEYPVMAPGEVRTFWIRFTNVGTETWTRGTWGRQVNLALNGDDKTPYRLGMAANWLWDDRIATTTTPATAPGETAEFRFQVRAPLQRGTYTLNLRPVVDGTVWLEDEGVFWTIVVR